MSRVPWAANGSTTDPCCDGVELAIKYDWSGTGQTDLDTKTSAFGESVGYACGDSGQYVQWLPGGDGIKDDTSTDGFERVDVRVNTAKSNGLWTSSYNIECYAGWYEPAGGSGSATIEVTYRGQTKTKGITPGSQSDCAGTRVATVIVYSKKQTDGSYFEIE